MTGDAASSAEASFLLALDGQLERRLRRDWHGPLADRDLSETATARSALSARCAGLSGPNPERYRPMPASLSSGQCPQPARLPAGRRSILPVLSGTNRECCPAYSLRGRRGILLNRA